MPNCSQNNLLKIELPVGILFRIYGEDAYPQVIQKVIEKLDIKDVAAFLSYSVSGLSDNTDFNEVLTNIYNIASISLPKDVPFNPVRTTRLFEAAAKDMLNSINLQKQQESSLGNNETRVDAIKDVQSIPMDSDVTNPDNSTPGLRIDDSIPEEARITRMRGAKTLGDLYKTYFVKNLLTNPHLLRNHFKKMVTRHWLSTEKNKRINDHFDSKRILDDIKNDAYKTISNYYRQSADAVASYGGNSNILLFTDVNRLPNGAKLISVNNGKSTVTSSSNKEFAVYEYSYTNNENIYYVLASDPSDVSVEDVKQFLDTVDTELVTKGFISDFEVTSVYSMDPDLKPKQVNRYTADESVSSNKNLLNAFFSIITINELETLVDGFAQELNSTIKERFRVGPVDVDKAGSSMETKMLRLGVTSTPKILVSSNLKKVSKLLDGIEAKMRRRGGTIASHLASLNIIQKIDAKDNVMFKHTFDDREISSVIVNVGSTIVTMSYDKSTMKWMLILPNLTPGDGRATRLAHYNVESIEREYANIDKVINRDFKNMMHSIFDLFNNVNNDFNQFSEVFSKVTNLSGQEANEIIDSTNNKDVVFTSNSIINLTTLDDSQQEGFLRMADTITSADILSELPNDFEEAGEYLLKKADGTNAEANVARALYYKFFHKGEYTITEVDPVTGRLVTSKHMSIYEKARRYNDEVAWEALLSLQCQLGSTVLDNKMFLNNSFLIQTIVNKSYNVKSILDSIDTDGLESTTAGKRSLILEDIESRFVVRKESGGIAIDYYSRPRTEKMEPTVSFLIKGEGSGIVVKKGALGYQVLYEMMTYLKMPITIKSLNFYDSFKLSIGKNEDDAVEATNRFFGKLILLRLANATNESGSKHVFGDLRVKADSDGKVLYTFKANYSEYEKSIEDAINRLYTRAFRSTIEGPTGDKFSSSIYKNLSKSKRAIVRKFVEKFADAPEEFMFNNSKLIEDHEFLEIVTEFTRLGLKVGMDAKGTSQLNQRELATVLIGSFIQSLTKGTDKEKFKVVLSTDGVQSDRTKIDMFRSIIDDEFGDAAPFITKDGKHYLNEEKLRDRFFDEQRRSFEGLQKSIIVTWKRYLDGLLTDEELGSISSLRDIYNILQRLQLDYDEVAHRSGLIENFSIIKKTIEDEDGNKRSIASINYSMVHMSEVMLGSDSDETARDKKQFFLDMFFNEFVQYQDSIGFNVSLADIKVLQERFEYLKNLTGKEKYEAARDLALKLYFYNEAVMEQELAQMGMGSIFQYHKSKVSPLFEAIHEAGLDIDSKETTKKAKTKTHKDILEFITNYNFGGKTPISVKMDFKKLFSIGPKAMPAASIKAILEAKNISPKDKVRLIEYLDIFSQLSPMYIERVKRNQANGTSGMRPVLAGENTPGILLDQHTKTVTIDDPSVTAFILNSGFTDINIYDGTQIAMPSYYYKLNRSLGNRFNNFRSTSFLKSVNASKTPEGVAIYEKSATFSLFGWELLTNGTPELHSLHKTLMDKEKFADYDINYDGLYLLPKQYLLKSSGTAPFVTDLDFATFKKHGDYLGEVEVVFKDSSSPEKVNAGSLLYEIQNGLRSEDDIVSIKTDKILISGIKSKLDIYNYYGGVEGNLAMLDNFTTTEDKEGFIDAFPFGWVEYQVVNIMSNYRGVNGNYPIRNAEVNKINLSTAVKTGRKNVNPSSTLSNKYLTTEDIETSDASNDQLYIILQAEHEFDSTKEYNEEESHEASTVAMMTQPISNTAMEGSTMREVMHMDLALASLTDKQLELLNTEIQSYIAFVESTDANDSAERQYISDILRRALNTRTDADTAKALVGTNSDDARKTAFDLRILVPILRTSVNAEFNRRIIKKRFPGGQFVVSPATDQMRTYSYNGNNSLTRSAVNNRRTADNSINGVLKNEITSPEFGGMLVDSDWKLLPVTSLEQLKAEHTESDYVYEKTYVKKSKKPVYKAIRVSELLETVKSDDELKQREYVSPWINPFHQNILDTREALKAKEARIDVLAQLGNTLQEVINYFDGLKDSVGLSEDDIEMLSLIGDAVSKDRSILEKPIAKGIIAVKHANMMPFENMLAGYLKAHSENRTEGNKLKWMQYFKNGVNLQETEEYMSYFLAGKAPAAISNKTTNQDKLSWFTSELSAKVPSVPKFMWARYMISISNNDTLKGSPVLGLKTVDELYKAFETIVASGDLNNELLTGFFNYVQSFEKKEASLTKLFRFQLEHMLEEDGWEYEPSEFYMPPQHMAAFLITYGDQIQDIIGSQKQPELAKMISVINHHAKQNDAVGITEDEKLILETKFINDDPEYAELKAKIEAYPIGVEYLEARRQQQEKMLTYFGSKIDQIIAALPSAKGKEIDGMMEKAPLLLLEYMINKTPSKVGDTLKKLITMPHVVGNSALFETLSQAYKLIADGDIASARALITREAVIFKNVWKENLANNFEKSLTFITSRIPSQAKQQTTVGKIKSFVYSTKNAIYVPIELIAISGCDYDIDKQNNMTWSVDEMGKIVDWRPYIINEDDGINADEVDSILNREISVLKQGLINIGASDAEISKQVNAYKEAKLEYISKAIQNYVLHKLMQISGSSKNAIEAATVTAMNKLGVIKEYMASFKISEEYVKQYGLEYEEDIDKYSGKVTRRYKPNEKLFNLLRSRQLAIPYTPSTKMLYEKVNMDGAMGISIFASAIKAYTTIFKATLDSATVRRFGGKLDTKLQDIMDEVGPELSEINKAMLHGISSTELDYARFGSKTKPPVQLVWFNPTTGLFEETAPLEYVANSKKFIPRVYNPRSKYTDEDKYYYPALQTKLAKEAYNKLVFAASPEEETEIVLKYKELLENDATLRQENQAWQDLSELLSAATDNAKELILSTIGANNTTSSMIATMVVMGVDLHAILSIINDPIITKVVNDFEEGRTLIGKTEDFNRSMKQRLVDAKKIFSTKSFEDYVSDGIERNLVARGFVPGSKEFKQAEAELREAQETLFNKYNPAKQMSYFNDATREFTMLSGILKINTGMPNTELDVFNFFMQLENVLRTSVGNPNASIAAFLSEEDNGSARDAMIKAADEKKAAFNLPYILYKNKLFFSYIKTLYESNEMLKSLTYTHDILYNVILPKVKLSGRLRLEKEHLDEYLGLISNIAITTYYNKTNSIIDVPGFRSFDLSKARDRFEFINNITKIRDKFVSLHPELESNMIVKELVASVTKVDPETGKYVVLLGGLNTDINEEGDMAGYRLAMESIKEICPELYNVYFNYSLIIDKGALSRTSIATVFGADPYEDFAEHVLDLKASGKMVEIIKSLGTAKSTTNDEEVPLLHLLLPFTLKEFSTQKDFKNANIAKPINSKKDVEDEEINSDEFVDDHDVEAQMDYEQEAIEDMNEEEFQRYAHENKKSDKYDVSDMNALYEGGQYKRHKMFVSKTNGLTYIWLEIGDHFRSYVPITKNFGYVTNNVNIDEFGTIGDPTASTLNDFGYGHGWEIVLPNGRTGRLLKYDSETGDYFVLTSSAMSKQRLIKLDKHSIISKNPQFMLSKNFIMVKKGTYQQADPLTIKFMNNGEIVSLNHDQKITIVPGVTKYVDGDDVVQHSNKISSERITSAPKVKEDRGLFNNLKDKDYDRQITAFANYLFALTNMSDPDNTSVNLINMEKNGELVASYMRTYMNATGGGVTFPKDSNAEKLRLFFNKLFADDVNREEMYVFMRKTMSEKMKYINDNVFDGNEVLREYVKLEKIPTQIFNDSERKLINSLPSLLNEFSDKSGLASDVEFLTSVDFADTHISDYVDMLGKLGISRKEYVNEADIDVLTIGNFIEVHPNMRKPKKAAFSIKINTERSVAIQAAKIQNISPKVTSRLVKFLNDRFPDSKLRVLGLADLKILYPDIDVESGDEAFVNVGDNTIVLIRERATLDVLLHEMGHVYLAELRNKDLALYNELMKKMESSEIFNEVNQAYSKKNNYTKKDVLEEIFVITLRNMYASEFVDQLTLETSDKFDGILDDNGIVLGKIKTVFGDIFAESFGLKNSSKLSLEMTDSIGDIMKKVGFDIIFNKNSILNSMNRNDMRNLRIILEERNMTELQAEERLIKNGLIRKYCD